MSAEVSFTKRAAAELSRCFNGLTVSRSGSKKQSSGSAGASPANNNASSSSSNATSSSNSAKEKEATKPVDSTESTFLLAKGSMTKSSGLGGQKAGPAPGAPGAGGHPSGTASAQQLISAQTLITKANTTISPLKANQAQQSSQGVRGGQGAAKPGTPSHRPPVPRKTSIVKRKNYILRLAKPRTQKDLWMDFNFLNSFFIHFSSKDRTVLTQVCSQWRDVLYNETSFWKGLLPVIYCNELRRIAPDSPCSSHEHSSLTATLSKASSKCLDAETSGSPSPTESERSKIETIKSNLYLSLEMRAFDSICLFGATDSDVIDLASKISPNTMRRIVFGSLRCSSVSDKGLEIFLAALNQSLLRLELSGCNEVSDSGLWTSLIPRLESLTIQDCINVADETVAAITQMLPSLKELNLQAYHVTDASMAYFGPTAARENLRTLHLQHCWELSNQGVLSLAHGLPNLTTLSLSGCSKVTDDAIEVVAEQLRALRRLDLSWCSRISDAALEYIACDLSDSLQELVLDRCVHITDIGLGYLATMGQISSLSLRWCPQIRDFGLQTLCSLKTLKVLSLAGCPQLSVNGLSCLVQMQQLTELELTNCPGASKELLKYLKDHLPPSCLLIV